MGSRFKQALKQFWICRLFRWITRDKTLCPICNKNPNDAEFKMCFNCYYKMLRKSK